MRVCDLLLIISYSDPVGNDENISLTSSSHKVASDSLYAHIMWLLYILGDICAVTCMCA